MEDTSPAAWRIRPFDWSRGDLGGSVPHRPVQANEVRADEKHHQSGQGAPEDCGWWFVLVVQVGLERRAKEEVNLRFWAGSLMFCWVEV